MKHFLAVVLKVVGVPLVMATMLMAVFAVWSLYCYGGVRYGLDRLNGYAVVPIEPVIDLGEVESGQTVAATFRLKNLSGKDVTVLGAESECQCSAVDGLPVKIKRNCEISLPVFLIFNPQETNTLIERRTNLMLDCDHPMIYLTAKASIKSFPDLDKKRGKPMLAPLPVGELP